MTLCCLGTSTDTSAGIDLEKGHVETDREEVSKDMAGGKTV